jgi:hypothetical protein
MTRRKARENSANNLVEAIVAVILSHGPKESPAGVLHDCGAFFVTPKGQYMRLTMTAGVRRTCDQLIFDS